MDHPTGHYWKIRLVRCKRSLERNGFDVFLADSPIHAKDIILQEILPKIAVVWTVSWGDSMTLHATGILDIL
jgi:hypothetical protein